jgi:hypothetical protein
LSLCTPTSIAASWPQQHRRRHAIQGTRLSVVITGLFASNSIRTRLQDGSAADRGTPQA